MIKKASILLCLVYFSLPLPNILAELPAKKGDQALKSQPITLVHEHETVRPGEADPGSESQRIGVDEKLGHIIPLNLTFNDENNQPVILKDFIRKPTLLLPIFYYCPQVCSIMLANLATALNDVTFIPGDDYRVLALSFNDEEGPEIARKAKTNYSKILDKDFPVAEWKFLTGRSEDILSLTNKIGFYFKKTGQHEFIHPNVLIVLASDGKIIRYVYGPRFLAFDIGMALAEAKKGTPGISIKRLLTYCFDYDPKGKKYVFRTFRILGIVILVLLSVFYFFFLRKGNK